MRLPRRCAPPKELFLQSPCPPFGSAHDEALPLEGGGKSGGKRLVPYGNNSEAQHRGSVARNDYFTLSSTIYLLLKIRL